MAQETDSQRRWRLANPDKVSAYKRAWADRNREKERERSRKRVAVEREARRARAFEYNQTEAGRLSSRRRAKRWRARNPEKRAEQKARYYKKNRDRHLAKSLLCRDTGLSRANLPEALIEAKIIELHLKRALKPA